jgi:Putative prokaryotic signal transducing protein
MDELVVAEVVGTEPEAELVCSLLRSAGIRCTSRVTNLGAGASDGLSVGGPHEVIVRQEDLESAREVLRTR